MFYSIKKILSNYWTKIIITVLIIFFLLKKIDLIVIQNHLANISGYFWILYFVLSIPIPLLFMFKWAYFLNKHKKISTYFNFIKSIGLSDILNTSLFVEIFKFNSLKNFSLSKKISSLIIEKFFVLIAKIISTILLVGVYVINYYNNNTLIFIIITFPLIYILIKFDIILIYFLKLVKKKFNFKLINIILQTLYEFKKKINFIFIIDIGRVFVLLTLYYFILICFFNIKITILILLFTPLIETLLKLLTFSFFGTREILIFYMGGLMNIDQNAIVTASIILSFYLILINLTLLVLLTIHKYFITMNEK
jgi:hypothetical protein